MLNRVERAALGPAVTAAGSSIDVPRTDRYLDLTIALIALPFIVLIGAVIGVAIYIDSPGPVLFRTSRVGRGGEIFTMFKFRKMRRDAPSAPLTTDRDVRFTPIGRFLSATRLDELPQIWNVLRGDMRLVGPRPEDPCFVSEFPSEYAEILTVTPGVTGNAQLRFLDEKSMLTGPDPEATYRQLLMPMKVQIDVDYVRSHSVARDLSILARTAIAPLLLLVTRLRARACYVRLSVQVAATVMALATAFVVTSNHLP